MNAAQITEFGKAVKKRLIDVGRNSDWLVDEVRAKTGLYFDSAYLSRVLRGINNSPKIIDAIRSVLDLRE